MLIALFRTSYLPQYISLVVVGVALWMPAFLEPPGISVTEHSIQPVYNLIADRLVSNLLLPVIIGFIILIAQSLIFNMVMISQGLVSKNSMVPAIVYVVLMSTHYANLTLTPLLLSGFLILALLNKVYGMYEKSDNLMELFSVGLIISLASMIYFPSVFFLLFILYVLVIYRIVTWREWTVPFVGFIIPYLYLWVYYFWAESLAPVYSVYEDFFSRLFTTTLYIDTGDIIVEAALVLLLLLPVLLRITSSMGSHNILTRKKLSVSNWLLVITLIITFTTGNLLQNNLYVLGGAVIVSHNFDITTRSGWNELIFLLFTAGTAVNNYF
jgi:hypothetical protein